MVGTIPLEPLFALGGHFTAVIKHWRHDVLTPPKMNNLLLSECGTAAIAFENDAEAEREVIRLLDRVFVIALVVFAVMVL